MLAFPAPLGEDDKKLKSARQLVQDGQVKCRDISRRDIRNFRTFLHQYELRGRESMTEKIGQDSLSYARGYLSFVHMVCAEQEAQIKAKHLWLERREM